MSTGQLWTEIASCAPRQLLTDLDHQRRGYRLEKILREVFELFDLDPRASFKIVGEQIDGAFTFEGTDYLFEGKWQQVAVSAADLDVLAGKLSRKLDNTLGLFLSVNGFSEGRCRGPFLRPTAHDSDGWQRSYAHTRRTDRFRADAPA